MAPLSRQVLLPLWGRVGWGLQESGEHMQRRVPRLHLVAGVRALVAVGPVPDQRAGDAGREVCRELGADCRGSVGQGARVLHPDADLADKQRLAQRAALVEPELQLRSEGARRAAVIVNLTEIDSRDA